MLKGGLTYCIKRLRGQSYPLAATLLVTLQCNLRCAYCDFPSRQTTQMSTEELLDVVRALARAGTVRYSVSGGEPLLRSDLGQVLAEIRRLGGLTSLTTNGTLLADRLEEVGPVDYLLATLEGDEATHDRLRGPGSHRRTVRGLESVRARYPDKKLGLITGVSRTNAHALGATFDVARELGCRVHFQPIQSTHSWGGDTSTLLEQEEIRSVFRELLALKNRGFPIGNSRAYLEFILENPVGRADQKCYAGRYVMTILPDGSMVNCCMILGTRTDWPNVLHQDLATCMEQISRKECQGCTASPYVENALLLDLEPSSWKEVLTWR